jgi:hypothetical protein
MGTTLVDVSLLLLLLSLGALAIPDLLGRWRDEAASGKAPEITCARHEWVRCEPDGLICRRCGKTPG